ncbi:MAG: FAD-dependent oxidoreductase [Elusimicrobiota bacterium]|nr:FAD-dependent oxidoreductase [Elusimicrobiota bacterium]
MLAALLARPPVGAAASRFIAPRVPTPSVRLQPVAAPGLRLSVSLTAPDAPAQLPSPTVAAARPEQFAAPRPAPFAVAAPVAAAPADAPRAHRSPVNPYVPPAGAGTASLADVLDSFTASSRLYDGLAGRRGSVTEVEEFRQLAERLYLTPAWSASAASPSALRRELTRALPTLPRRGRVLRAVLELPKLTAEGIVRTRVYAPSARALELDLLAEGWPTAADGRAIADAVVVGGGPGGLSTALHAADAGARVVVFEAGHLAQSFTDAGMRPVYRMRTPSPRNSLAQAPFSPPGLIARAGLETRLELIRGRGQRADASRFRREGSAPQGRARNGLDPSAPADAAAASARNELLQHFAATADEVESLGSKLVERAPVSSWRVIEDPRHGRLYEVRTGAGHRVYARNLVLAQGQVGADGEHGRSMDALASALRPAETLILKDRRALDADAKRLASLASALRRGRAPPRLPVVHDGLLGMPEVREIFALLPAGSRVAVAGSGESAAKAALDLLRVNRGLSVDLFVKGRLSAAQLQIPKEHATPDAIAAAHSDPARARETLDEWKAFGTPVTPDTLSDLMDARLEGRVTLHELDGRFAPDGAAWLRRGSHRKPTYLVTSRDGARLAAIDGGFVWATGYDRGSLRADPLTASLETAGRLVRVGGDGHDAQEFRRGPDGLSSALDARLFVVGAQSFSLSADSAIPGIVARAARVAETIARSAASATARARARRRR